eukprot:CAMPEP_0196733428 /NCGR_PEP_ID=MMETSP1091-20130531/12487_1 /TAXON_ID=302021 /ORGANISM="Rhodomonas sp., Strain CCMP768" /LENGTH=114 /DNA_ID=CAMNT_0042076799 /DNA_START=251 /DNA_END=596 /DNA_ORIENTATION=-
MTVSASVLWASFPWVRVGKLHEVDLVQSTPDEGAVVREIWPQVALVPHPENLGVETHSLSNVLNEHSRVLHFAKLTSLPSFMLIFENLGGATARSALSRGVVEVNPSGNEKAEQ